MIIFSRKIHEGLDGVNKLVTSQHPPEQKRPKAPCRAPPASSVDRVQEAKR